MNDHMLDAVSNKKLKEEEKTKTKTITKNKTIGYDNNLSHIKIEFNLNHDIKDAASSMDCYDRNDNNNNKTNQKPTTNKIIKTKKEKKKEKKKKSSDDDKNHDLNKKLHHKRNKLTKKASLYEENEKRAIDDANKRIENAKQSQKEYQNKIDISNALTILESNKKRISISSKMRKSLQRKSSKREVLLISIQRNNAALKYENEETVVGENTSAHDSGLLRGMFDELQDEKLLLKEQNNKMKEQITLWQNKYVSVAKERRRFQKSMNALFEFMTKYISVATDQSLSNNTFDQIEQYIYIQHETEIFLLSCHDSGQNRLDKVEIEFGPADQRKNICTPLHKRK